MLKKIVSFLLIFLVLPIYILPTVLAESNVIADLTSVSSIHRCGLAASNKYIKSGSFTMKWDGVNLHNNVKISVRESDFTRGNYLEFWAYSEAATGMNFTVALVSDNSETICLDYYYKKLTTNWQGWKLISLKLGDEGVFTEKNQPIGYSSIDRIEFWPKFEGSMPVDGTCLYFDKMLLTEEQSKEANLSGGGSETETLTIADFSILSNITATGFPASREYTYSGDYSLKMKGESIKALSIDTNNADWTKYSVIKLNIYSTKKATSPIYIVAKSDDPSPEAPSWDHFIATLNIDWTGWKTVELNMKDSFTKGYKPLGWQEIQQFNINPYWTNKEDHTQTEIYIDKIWLETGDTGNDSSGDETVSNYIIPAQKKEGDVDYASKVIEKNQTNNGHPRLLMEPGYFERVKALIETDTYLRNTYNSIISQADVAVANTVNSQYPATYGESFRAKTLPEWKMIPNLTIAYKMTGEAKYKDRLWQAINTVINFPDWHSGSFLDVGDNTQIIAYAYDWMYDDWSEEQKTIMRNSFVKKGFEPSMYMLRSSTGFASVGHNWNQVISSGLGLAALAMVGEEGYNDICNEIINRTIGALAYGCASFAPDGGSVEGPGYWLYAQQTFFQYQAGLMTAAGDDGGMSQREGLSKTGYYILSMNGPTNQCFNYSDSSSTVISDGVFHWMAKLYNQPGLSAFRIKAQNGVGDWLDFMLYDPEIVSGDTYQNVPLDASFGGAEPVGMMCSAWDDSQANYIGYKGGDNQSTHGHLDIGSFVLDSQGKRWFAELGGETYGKPDLFASYGIGAERWKFYKMRAEGHNTLVINPTNGEDQKPSAKSEITKTQSSDSASYAVIDMTQAYEDVANSVTRGFALVNNRSTFVVQDEIRNKSVYDVYSFFHTQAQFDMPDENTKSVILNLDGKKMKAEIMSPANAVFKKMSTTPMYVRPTKSENDTIKGYSKLAVYVPQAKNVTISVMFTPVYDNAPETTPPALRAISEWDSYLQNPVALENINVDGIPINKFSSNNTAYNVPDGTLGIVSAIGGDGVVTEVLQANEDTKTAYVVARSELSGQSCVYTVSFAERVPSTMNDKLQTYEIKAVTASDVPEKANIPEHTFDKNLATRWTSQGEQWIMWDFGEEIDVEKVKLSFTSGNVRQAIFTLDTSTDGVNFTTVFDGKSSGTTLEPEEYQIAPVKARYIRFNGHGNTINTWNNISEFSVPVVKHYNDLKNHWAEEEITYLTNIGLVNGKTDESFVPDSNITVAEFVAMAVRTADIPRVEYRGELRGVSRNDWFANDIQTAVDNGFLPAEMLSGNVLNPNENITREQMCAIMVNVYERLTKTTIKTYGLERFVDIDEFSEYAKIYVDKGLTIRVIRGIDDMHFAPKARATRAQASVIIKRLYVIAAE